MVRKSIDTWAVFDVDNSDSKKYGGSEAYGKATCRHYSHTLSAQASRLTAHLKDYTAYRLSNTLADPE